MKIKQTKTQPLTKKPIVTDILVGILSIKVPSNKRNMSPTASQEISILEKI